MKVYILTIVLRSKTQLSKEIEVKDNVGIKLLTNRDIKKELVVIQKNSEKYKQFISDNKDKFNPIIEDYKKRHQFKNYDIQEFELNNLVEEII